MAFIVDEEFQGRGSRPFCYPFPHEDRTRAGIKRLAATVLPQNDKMLRVFEKGEVKPKSVFADGVLELRFEL